MPESRAAIKMRLAMHRRIGLIALGLSAVCASSAFAQSPNASVQKYPEVLAVKIRAQSAGQFDFDVTVSSPYDSPSRYADAFRVAGKDGQVYAERIPLHDHAGEQPFTRDLYGVAIPRGVRIVVVQARDQKYGYGGRIVEAALPGRQSSRLRQAPKTEGDKMAIKALTLDTGGTILDWHGGISRAFAAAGARRGLQADWHEVTNEYRRRSLKGMVGLVHPDFNFDDLHRRMLDEVIAHYKLDALAAEDRNAIWRTWHELDAWPDFPAVQARLRRKYVVASLTLLTTSLVIDVAKKNGFDWDAIISCEMIGIYKTRPESYLTAAKWLQLDPSEIMMVACHNFDLNAARENGYKTAFVKRPAEWGPAGPPDPTPNPAHDLIVDGFEELAARLGA